MRRLLLIGMASMLLLGALGNGINAVPRPPSQRTIVVALPPKTSDEAPKAPAHEQPAVKSTPKPVNPQPVNPEPGSTVPKVPQQNPPGEAPPEPIKQDPVIQTVPAPQTSPPAQDGGVATTPPTAPDAPAPSAQPPAEPTPIPPPLPIRPRVAVLIYHDVETRADSIYTITPDHLEAQIAMLQAEGYYFYTLADLERLLAGDPLLPEKGVLLTFDDGYSSFYSAVIPLATRYEVPVVCFVITKYLDQLVLGSRPHMSAWETKQAAASPLADLGGHSYDGHYEATSVMGLPRPVLTHRIVRSEQTQVETETEYQERVRDDFARTAALLESHDAAEGLRHFAFPFTTRSDEAVRLGSESGFTYYYVGGEALASAETDPTAIPRIHAGAPYITAEVLKNRLEILFSQP